MTAFTTQLNNYRALFDTDSPTAIDWSTTRRNLTVIAYNLAIVLGLLLYLTFLAAKATFNAGYQTRCLWEKYEVLSKIKCQIATLQREVPTLAQRLSEVKAAYAQVACNTTTFITCKRAELDSIYTEFLPETPTA